MNYAKIAMGLITIAMGAALMRFTPIMSMVQIVMGALLVTLTLARIIRKLEGK